MSLAERYAEELAARGFCRDSRQDHAVALLERLGETLQQQRPPPRRPWGRWRDRLVGTRSVEPPRGVYLWGGVGRGKTFLMDLFLDWLPFDDKLRRHFHRFMYDVHRRLEALGERRDPLERVGDEIAARTRVLCFDEFFVSDIADAMILGNLLDALFRRGVALVATSNVAPRELYRDGLQRQRFLPAIDLLEQHTQVVDIGHGTDYRLRVLESAEIWHAPADDAAERNLEHYFAGIAPGHSDARCRIEVANRVIEARRCAKGVAWFDFEVLCTSPRAPVDYLEIARCHHTVLLSAVPRLDAVRDDDARRFIALVDVFYDHRVKLIVSAAAAPEEIYAGKRLAFEFRRTRSRLREMRQHEYLAQAHLP